MLGFAADDDTTLNPESNEGDVNQAGNKGTSADPVESVRDAIQEHAMQGTKQAEELDRSAVTPAVILAGIDADLIEGKDLHIDLRSLPLEKLLQVAKHAEARLTRYRELDPANFAGAFGKVDFALLDARDKELQQNGSGMERELKKLAETCTDENDFLSRMTQRVGLDQKGFDRLARHSKDIGFSEVQAFRKNRANTTNQIWYAKYAEPLLEGLFAWRKWMDKQATERGETDIKLTERSAETLKGLRNTVRTLKEQVDQNLRERAEHLRQQLKARHTGEPTEQELQTLGITRSGYLKAVADAGTFLEQVVRVKGGKYNALTTGSASYLAYAERMLERLKNVERDEATSNGAGFEHQEILIAAQEQWDTEQWARGMQPRLEALQSLPAAQWKQAKEALAKLVKGGSLQRAQLGKGIRMNHVDLKPEDIDIANLEQWMTEHAAALAAFASPQGVSQVEKERLWRDYAPHEQRSLSLVCSIIENPNLVPKDIRTATPTEIPKLQAKAYGLRRQATEARAALLPRGMLTAGLEHRVCHLLGIRDQLEEEFSKVDRMIESGLTYIGDLDRAEARLETMRVCAQKLTELESSVGYIPDASFISSTEMRWHTGHNARGVYDRKTGRILINRDTVKTPQERSEVYEHERGHAIVEILTGASGLFPTALSTFEKKIGNDVPSEGNNQTVLQLLEAVAPKWGIGKEEEYESPQEYRRHLFDELLNRYAEWLGKSDGDRQKAKPLENALYRYLQERFGDNSNIQLAAALATAKSPLDAGRFRFSTEDEDINVLLGGEASPKLSAEGGAGGGGDSSSYIYEDLRSMYTKIESIKIFYTAYPEYVDPCAAWYEQLSEAYKVLEQEVKNSNIDLPTVRKHKTIIETELSKCTEEIDRVRGKVVEKMEGGRGGRGTGWRGVLSGIEWISLADLYNVGVQAVEDLGHMWKRRGEAVRARVGEKFVDWIPAKVPYLGRLKGEFQRRGHQSDLDEVEHIKGALKDADAWTLLHHLHDERNADHLRAIIELLTEKGRMDWNDVGFWETLNDLSQYRMPVEACKNDTVLRDMWLQKLITDIWADKDHFYNWRQSNDSGIESGRKKFNGLADQLSNVSGGLSGRMQSMLQLWCEKTHDGKEIHDVPSEINPHLYEELLYYAMRNGKCSMEQKMFYLVQGVRYNLLSLERLQYLAGEGGGVLNRFPFIDYFYKHNNSKSEIERISNRIQEGTKEKRFKEGRKTTIWFHLEVLRDENVRQRISKGTSKTNAEGLDHEDVPAVMSSADYALATELLGVISGSRFKLSPEGMKNAYVGFATRFKLLSRVATLQEKNKARFTPRDLAELSKSMLAYMHYDNIITDNGNKGTLGKLTWDQINETGAPSIGTDLKVKDVRNGNKNLMRDLFLRVLPASVWSKEKYGVGREEYFRMLGDKDEFNNGDAKNKEAIFAATGKIAADLPRLLKENEEAVLQILRNHAGTLVEEMKETKGTTEPEQYLKISDVEEYFENIAATKDGDEHAHAAH